MRGLWWEALVARRWPWACPKVSSPARCPPAATAPLGLTAQGRKRHAESHDMLLSARRRPVVFRWFIPSVDRRSVAAAFRRIGHRTHRDGRGTRVGDAPLRCLLVVKGLGLGGAERIVVSHALHPPPGVEVEVVNTDARVRDLAGELSAAGVVVHHLDRRRAGWIRGLWALLQGAARPHLVHVHSPLPAVVLRVMRCLLPGASRPILVSTEHNLPGAYHPATRQLNRVTGVLDDHRFAVSEEVRRALGPTQARRTETLVHGVDSRRLRTLTVAGPRVRSELGIGPDELLVVTVGRLRPEKDHRTLLLAAAAVRERCPNVRFVVAGDGPELERLEQLHLELALGDGLRLLGARPDGAGIIAAGDVMCLSSRYEGLPLTVMEALVLGRPVVATRVGGIPELVRDGVEGRLVLAGDHHGLAEALIEVLSSPTQRALLGCAAEARGRQIDDDAARHKLALRYRELLEVGR